MWEDVHSLFENTALYYKSLQHAEPDMQWSWHQSPMDTEGQLYTQYLRDTPKPVSLKD